MFTVIRFTKMHGLGNDFVVINAIAQTILLTPEHIRFIADRHRGIGCDQVLLVENPTQIDSDFFYRIFNADGTEVEHCGNGARCLAKFIRDEKLSDKTHLRVNTTSRLLSLQIKADETVEVDMGKPENIHDNQVSMGNPHIVMFVDDIHTVNIEKIGQFYNQSASFPGGINVGFMQIIDRQHILLRVYERGVGETQACGTGACAAAVIGISKNLLDAEVEVTLPGGNLTIYWKNPESPVLMTGPAVSVFHGEIALSS